jgi:hypothetical protein
MEAGEAGDVEHTREEESEEEPGEAC